MASKKTHTEQTKKMNFEALTHAPCSTSNHPSTTPGTTSGDLVVEEATLRGRRLLGERRKERMF
jgi:hypothetical protein